MILEKHRDSLRFKLEFHRVFLCGSVFVLRVALCQKFYWKINHIKIIGG